MIDGQTPSLYGASGAQETGWKPMLPCRSASHVGGGKFCALPPGTPPRTATAQGSPCYYVVWPLTLAAKNSALCQAESSRMGGIVSGRNSKTRPSKRFSVANVVLLKKLAALLNVRLVKGSIAKLMRGINNVSVRD
jgi:hypothetical protein